MASPATLDIDALLAPIPGDSPAGEARPQAIAQMEEARREVDPATSKDPHAEPKAADWRRVVALGTEALTETSKHVRIACMVAEALVAKDEFPGVRDGLRLLRRLFEECGDRLQPKPDEDDNPADHRDYVAGLVAWLANPTGGALYPNRIRAVPFLNDGSRTVSYVQWRELRDGDALKGTTVPTLLAEQVEADTWREMPVADRTAKAKERSEQWLRAGRTQADAAAEDLAEALDEITQLAAVLDRQLEGESPDLSPIRVAIEDTRRFVAEVVKLRGGPAEAASDEAAEVSDGGGSAPAGRGGRATFTGDREGAYAELSRIADLLIALEPHSPVPHLIRRTVELRDLGFADLVEQLARDRTVFAFLRGDGASGGGE